MEMAKTAIAAGLPVDYAQVPMGEPVFNTEPTPANGEPVFQEAEYNFARKKEDLEGKIISPDQDYCASSAGLSYEVHRMTGVSGAAASPGMRTEVSPIGVVEQKDVNTPTPRVEPVFDVSGSSSPEATPRTSPGKTLGRREASGTAFRDTTEPLSGKALGGALERSTFCGKSSVAKSAY